MKKKNNSSEQFNVFFKKFASLKLTVFCILFLIVLVFWGTIYQTNHGLYQAQQRFFYSWYFFLFGFIPLPGTVFISFILSLNLIASLFFRISFKLSNIGNIITHFGLIILLLGGGVTLFFSVNSSLVLKEGQTKHMSSVSGKWEVAVWEKGNDNTQRTVYAFDVTEIQQKKTFILDTIELEIMKFHTNCFPVFAKSDEKSPFINSSGIINLRKIKASLEAGNNIAGTIFKVRSGNKRKKILLFSRDKYPTQLSINKKVFNFKLRKKTYILPIKIKLKDFRIKKYLNSNIVKSYESIVEISNETGMTRDVKISMNKPLRYENLTFFQSSYSIDSDGTEYSIFSVVKNSGRLLPYISSLFIFFGLAIHFIIMFYTKRRKLGGTK